jgi:hypothetical protein
VKAVVAELGSGVIIPLLTTGTEDPKIIVPSAPFVAIPFFTTASELLQHSNKIFRQRRLELAGRRFIRQRDLPPPRMQHLASRLTPFFSPSPGISREKGLGDEGGLGGEGEKGLGDYQGLDLLYYI